MPGTALPGPPPLNSIAKPAVFLDFDGTLVPIAPEPGAIDVPGDLGSRLEALAERLEGRLALVSGRSLDDLASHVGQVALYRGGSHGAHVAAPDGEDLRPADAIPEAAKSALRDYADSHDLYFEDKPHGAGLHSRKAPAKFDAMAAFANGVADEHGLAAKEGKQVVELVRPGADKGSAVATILARTAFEGSTPVFLGDDVTDEDGFRACADAGGFGIAVGERASGNARYRLDTIDEVYEWLDL